jgi:hypothetical protein
VTPITEDKAKLRHHLIMSKKDEVLASIHRLINEQMEALRGKLNPGDAKDYVERRRQIEVLLDRIRRNGTTEDVA